LIISFHYLLTMSIIFEISLFSVIEKGYLVAGFINLILICFFIPAYSLKKIYEVGKFQSIWPSKYMGKNCSWAIYKNKKMIFTFGPAYFEYNEENCFFIIYKLVYSTCLAVAIGSLYSYPLVQLLVLLLTQSCFILFLRKQKPYQSPNRERMQEILHVLRLINIIVSVFFVDEFSEIFIHVRGPLSIFSLILHLLGIVIVVLTATYTFCKFSSYHLYWPCPSWRSKSIVNHIEQITEANNYTYVPVGNEPKQVSLKTLHGPSKTNGSYFFRRVESNIFS